jgi:hypothetical protein
MLMLRGWCPLLGKLCGVPLDFLLVLSHDAIPDVFSIASLAIIVLRTNHRTGVLGLYPNDVRLFTPHLATQRGRL